MGQRSSSLSMAGWGMTGLRVAFTKAWGYASRDLYLWSALCVGCSAYFYLRFIRHPAGGELYRHAALCLWGQRVLQVCAPDFTYTPTFAFIMLPSIAKTGEFADLSELTSLKTLIANLAGHIAAEAAR